MNIVNLYYDSSFDSFLLWLARKGRIFDFDQFRQDVFSEIVEKECDTMVNYKRAARRVQHQYVKHLSREADISMYAHYRATDHEEPECVVMTRLILEDRARKLG